MMRRGISQVLAINGWLSHEAVRANRSLTGGPQGRSAPDDSAAAWV
jgi:hypothetical protein